MEPTNLERLPLQAHLEELLRRREAVENLQGGSTYFEEDLQIFTHYAREQEFIFSAGPRELTRPPSDEGNEHQVWFLEQRGTFLKATWPGFFGLKVVHRPDEDSRASPIDYLERWQLHNECFGDDVRFLGVIPTDKGLRLLIEQPAISGIPATEEQIRTFFTGNGWRPFVADEETAFCDPIHHIAISDTHRGNMILMDDGLLAPIDLRVQRLSGALLDIVSRLSAKS